MAQWTIISVMLSNEMPMNRPSNPPHVENMFVMVYISDRFKIINSLLLKDNVNTVDMLMLYGTKVKKSRKKKLKKEKKTKFHQYHVEL